MVPGNNRKEYEERKKHRNIWSILQQIYNKHEKDITQTYYQLKLLH